MATSYHDHEDLVKVRPDIMNYGVEDFSDQMEESEDIVERVIETQWYRNVALNYDIDWRSTPFDSTLLLTATTQLRRVCVYKSLELIYLFLMKESKEPDAFERQCGTFKKLYQEEMSEVLRSGLDYDWDETGSLASDERLQPSVRRLYRV
jgi:hypothetical protein